MNHGARWAVVRSVSRKHAIEHASNGFFPLPTYGAEKLAIPDFTISP
jgi:hypothetical protein